MNDLLIVIISLGVVAAIYWVFMGERIHNRLRK